MSGSACSLPCTSFLFLDQKIIAERHLLRAQEQPNIPICHGPIASSTLAQAVLQKVLPSLLIPALHVPGHEDMRKCQPCRLLSGSLEQEGSAPAVTWCIGREGLGDKGLSLLGGDLLWVPRAFIPAWHQSSVVPPAMRGGTFTVPNPGESYQDTICTETEASLSSKPSSGPLSGGASFPTLSGEAPDPLPLQGWD